MPRPGVSLDKDNCSICGLTAGNSYVCDECSSKIKVAQNSTDNLCDGCSRRDEIPECIPDNVIFGDGVGNDNIIECFNCPD